MTGLNVILEPQEIAGAMARGPGIDEAAQLTEFQIPTAKGVDVCAEANKRGMTIDRNALT
jgi:hypothetical protein